MGHWEGKTLKPGKAGGGQSRVGGCHAERPHPVLPGPLGRLFFPSSAHHACGFGGSPALAAPCFLPWDGFPAPQPAPHLCTSREQARSSRCCRAEPCAWLAERARSGVGANRAHGHIQRNREICTSPAEKAFISGWDPGEPRHKAPRRRRCGTLRGRMQPRARRRTCVLSFRASRQPGGQLPLKPTYSWAREALMEAGC